MSDNPDFQQDINLDAQSIDELVVNTARLGAQEITSREIVRTQTVPGGGGNETVTLQPPPGTIQQVVSVNFFTRPVTGASGNTHQLQVTVTPADASVLRYTSNDTDLLSVSHNLVASATQGSTPSGARVKQEAVKLLQATNADPVELTYINRAAGSQDNDREYTILLREVQV